MYTWSYSTRGNQTTAYQVPRKQYANIFYNHPAVQRFPAINPNPDVMDTGPPFPAVVYDAAMSLQSETATLANAAIFTSFGLGTADESNGQAGGRAAASGETSNRADSGTPAASSVTPMATPAQDMAQNAPTSLSATADSSEVTNTSTELSFCLPTSLAFFKNLTWEQTPWIAQSLDDIDVNFNPLSRADAKIIKNHLRTHLGDEISTSAIQNSLLLGSAYQTVGPHAPLGTYPHVFVIFPHATTRAARDPHFLRVWHDDIVKPAFDRAWLDSGKAPLYGAKTTGKSRLLPPTGVHTANDAVSSKSILTRLRNNVQKSVRERWPTWPDDESDQRATIMGDAWDAMKGMLKDHPDLADFQDPILLAVGRGEYTFSAAVTAKGIFKAVAVEWEKYVDARFVVPGSLNVVMQSVIGHKEEMEEVEQYEDYMVDWMRGTRQTAHKRQAGKEAGEDGDGDADGHRDKRRRA